MTSEAESMESDGIDQSDKAVTAQPDVALKSQPKTKALAAALALGILALHIWSLGRYPLPYVDEGWLISRAWQFMQTGQQYGPLDVGIFDRVPDGWKTIGRITPTLQAIGLIGHDHPQLVGPRAVSLAFGVALAICMFFIGRSLADWRLGAIASLLTALSPGFFYSSHLARNDIMAAACAYAAVAIHLANEKRQTPWLGLISGLMLTLGFDLHANASLLGPPILLLFLLDHGIGMLRLPRFWAFMGGVLIGLTSHLLFRIMPDPEAYVAIGKLSFGPVHVPPILTLDPAVIARAVVETGGAVKRAFPFSLPLFVAAMAMVAVLRDRLSMRVAAIALGTLASFTLMVRSKQDFYLIWFAPTLDLLVATLAYKVLTWDRWNARALLAARTIVVAAVFIVTWLNLPPLEVDWFAAYSGSQRTINTVVQPADSVIGRQQYWFGLYNNTFYSWEGLVHYRKTHPGASLEEAFEEHKPDILIMDDGLRKFFSDEPRGHTVLEALRLPRTEMMSILERRATPLVKFDGPYGSTVVYRLRWDHAAEESAGQ